jgi:hypothetical protein
MTLVEIVHTHPFATGVAVGVLLTFCCLVLCAVFLYSLEKVRATARERAKSTSRNQIASRSSISPADTGSVS